MKYRMLVHQPIAVAVEWKEPFQVRPPTGHPLAHIRQRNTDLLTQHREGGTQLALEFMSDQTDLMRTTHEGLELADDIFSALALSTGAPFQPCAPLYIEAVTSAPEVPLASFFGIEGLTWSAKVGADQIKLIQRAFRHWEALESGDRFRRAVRRYRQAIGREDWLEAFQDAYMGLEALEKPIAQELNVPRGHESVEGKCEHCGASYKRKRTVLSGIRAYICGNPDGNIPDEATKERIKEWKQLSGLRNKIVHGLEELSKLEAQAHEALPAALHYLHDTACHLIHAHELETVDYSYGRFTLSRIVATGGATKGRPECALEAWEPLMEIHPGRWVQYEKWIVPEFTITSKAGDIEVAFFTLTKPLSDASEEDLEPLRLQPGTAEFE